MLKHIHLTSGMQWTFSKKPISREKVSVWMGLSGSGHIIGPFFYEGNLNGNAYLQMLNEEIIPRLFELYGNRVDHLWWMQDEAPCYRTNVIRNRLREVFGNRIIGLGHTAEWPPRSPDLTPCDFFFCGAIWKTKSMKHPQLIRKIYLIVSDAMLLNLVIILKWSWIPCEVWENAARNA